MFEYEPKTDAELQGPCLAAGEYDATIVQANPRISKAGNSMLELKLRIYSDDGKSFWLSDFLMAKAEWKLKACCAQCGILDAYNDQSLSAEHFVGKEIRVATKIESSSEYGDQARVKGYPKVASATSAPAPPRKALVPPDDDGDAPF